MFKAIGRYLAPAPGVSSPMQWGSEERLRELFGSRVAAFQAPKKNYVFRYRSPKHWLDTFRTYYGPMNKAFGALDSGKQASLAEDLVGLAQRFNTASDGTMTVPGEYLEVVARVR